MMTADQRQFQYQTDPRCTGLVRCFWWCIIRTGDRVASEVWQKRKIPPPLSLDGRVGRRSPSAALNTSGSYKQSARSTKAVGLPSPRNPPEKLIEKQRALVV